MVTIVATCVATGQSYGFEAKTEENSDIIGKSSFPKCAFHVATGILQQGVKIKPQYESSLHSFNITPLL